MNGVEMVVTAKYICKKCGYAEKEKFSVIKIGKYMITLISMLLLVYFTLGMLLLGPSQFLQLHTSVIINYASFKSDNNIRSFTVNITRGCRGDDYCRVTEAYNHFDKNTIEYAYSGITKQLYTPTEVLNMNVGDCKAMSSLFANMMNNVGIFARVDCDMRFNHCVTYVFPRTWRIT